VQEDFDQIYQNCFDPVYRYVLSLSENPVIAEEITQETFFKALQSLDRFQGKSNLKSWLCAIAKNQWLHGFHGRGSPAAMQPARAGL